MANRAYLWSEDGSLRYDSRWTLPVAWLFLFRPDDLLPWLLPSVEGEFRSPWLKTSRALAAQNLRLRRRILDAVVTTAPAQAPFIDRFAASVARNDGLLACDPSGVCDDEAAAYDRMKPVLHLIDDPDANPEAIRDALRPMTGTLVAADFERQVVGFGYLPLSGDDEAADR